MSNAPNPNETQSRWLVIVPMIQLRISDAPPINGRWSVRDVTFLSENALRANLQPPTIPHPLGDAAQQRIFGGSPSYAVFERMGTPNQIRSHAFRDLRDAAQILAATAAFYTRRHRSCGFTVRGYPIATAKFDSFLDLDGTLFCGNWNQRGMLMPFDLDANWHQAITVTGIADLFVRLNDANLAPEWRRQIGSAAAMLGRSLMSLDLADAFLLDVIGLETLLTRQGERNGRRLAQRIKGMTGWHLSAHRAVYEDEIKRIHSVRCEIVHDSDYSNLNTETLLLADMYLANSLLNVVRLPNVFPDKAALAALADGFAQNENWPTDGSIPFRWFGNPVFDAADLDLPLW
jgi:hypothetical protein